VIAPVHTVEVPAPHGPTRAQATPDTAFLRTLVRRLGGDPGPADQSPSEVADRLAETGARRMMADAFLVPLLKEVREAAASEGIFAPGPGEKRFGSMLDAAYADQMLDSNHFPLADALEEKLRASFHRVAGIEPQPDTLEVIA